MRHCGQPVEDRYFIRLVGFRVGDLVVQVVLVNRQQDVSQYFLGLTVHVTNVVAIAGNNHQIGSRLQFHGLTIGFQQRRDVLADVRARQRQYDRTARVLQEAPQLPVDCAITFSAVCRVKIIQCRAGWNDLHVLMLIVVIETVLLLDLLVGAGYYQLGGRQYVFFNLDPVRHVVAFLDQVAPQTMCQQASAFDPSQGVTGMYQRYTQLTRQADADITGVGVMAVDNVGIQVMLAQPAQGVVGKHIKATPELFLGDIGFLTAVDSHNAYGIRQCLLVARIIRTQSGIENAPGQQVHPGDIGMFCKRPRQFDNIACLAAGIGIAPQFETLPAD